MKTESHLLIVRAADSFSSKGVGGIGQYQFPFRLLSNAHNCAQNLLCTVWVVQIFAALFKIALWPWSDLPTLTQLWCPTSTLIISCGQDGYGFFYWRISWFLFITIICDVWGCLGMMWLLPPSKFRINGLNPWNVNMPCEYKSGKIIILLHGDRKYFLKQIYPASFLFKILELLQTRWSHENPYFPIILPIKSTLSLSLFQW